MAPFFGNVICIQIEYSEILIHSQKGTSLLCFKQFLLYVFNLHFNKYLLLVKLNFIKQYIEKYRLHDNFFQKESKFNFGQNLLLKIHEKSLKMKEMSSKQ